MNRSLRRAHAHSSPTFFAIACLVGACGTSVRPDGATAGDGAADARGDSSAFRDAFVPGDAATPTDVPAPPVDAPVTPPDAAPVCSPPNTVLVGDRCIPSCGVAGGNTCLAAGAGLCDGEPALTSYDCARCCRRCDRRTAIPPSAPLIFYYGMIQDAAGTPDDSLNQRLLVPGLDVTFGVSNPALFDPPGWTGPVSPGAWTTGTNANYPTCADPPPAFATWHARGARLARLLSNDQLQAWLTDGSAADRIERILRFGWDYAAVDEIGGLAWRDGAAEGYGARAATLLDELARRGFDRRMIFWLNPGSSEVWLDPAVGNGVFPLMRGFLTACLAHCRRFLIEAYPQNATLCGTAGTPWTRCLTTRTVVGAEDTERYLEWTATRLGNAVPTINNYVLSGLGLGTERVTNYLDMPSCDLAPYRGSCPPSPTRGGLAQQFAALHAGAHANNQRGVAFYGITHVRTDTPGAVWTRADLAEHLRTLTSWWVGR